MGRDIKPVKALLGFRKYVIPELLPYFNVLSRMKRRGGFLPAQEFRMLLIVAALDSLEGWATIARIREVFGETNYHNTYIALRKKNLIERYGRRTNPVRLRIAKAGHAYFNQYSRLIQEEIINLEKVGISFKRF